MQCILGIVAVLVLISGITSARYWFKSSKVMFMPMVKENGELVPLQFRGNEEHWFQSIYLGMEKTGKFNKKAAVWTAIAVSLSTAASLISMFFGSA